MFLAVQVVCEEANEAGKKGKFSHVAKLMATAFEVRVFYKAETRMMCGGGFATLSLTTVVVARRVVA